MIRSTLRAVGLLGLTAGLTLASTIPASLTTFSVFAQYGEIWNRHYSTPGTTTIGGGLDVGSYYDFPASADPITYTGAGGYKKHPVNGQLWNDFDALTTALSGVTGSAIGSWAGLTPGTYTFTSAPTSLTLTTPGTYIFKYVGGSTLSFNAVNITLGAELSSDDVIWYVPIDVNITNSNFAGTLVVDDYGANVEANGESTSFTGRLLTEGTIGLYSWNSGSLTFNTQEGTPPPPVPEPGSVVLLLSALGFGAFMKFRRARLEAAPSRF